MTSGNVFEMHLEIWQVETNENIFYAKFKAPFQSPVEYCAYSNDEQYIISLDDAGTVRIWNIKNNLQILNYRPFQKMEEFPRTLKLIPKSDKAIAISSASVIKIWNIFTGEIIYYLKEESELYDPNFVIFSDLCYVILTDTCDSITKFYDIENGFICVTNGETVVFKELE